MYKISIVLTASLMIVAGIIGVGIGYYLTPQYSLTMYDKNVMSLGTSDRWLDLRYVNAMIAHHRGAILVAKQAEQSKRPEVHDLALEIQKSEPTLIAELYAWKKEWYGDTKMVQDPEVARLGTHDASFDLRFLNAIISHHDSGIVMTKEVRTKSSRTEVLDNTDAVEAFLTTTGKMLREWRKNWYQI
ncbi:MAG: DUF305 domain-containing protein [bacterium]